MPVAPTRCSLSSVSRLLLSLLAVVGLAPLAHASGVLIPRDGSAPIQVQSHRVRALVEDGLARTTVRQTFHNPHGRALEAVYVFPLPEGASLVGLAMEVGGRRLEGLLTERRTARRTYDALVRQNIDPALVEQIGRSKFRLSVFPVMPDTPTVVELVYIESVPLTDGEYRYVYPLALDASATRTEQDLTVSVTLRSSAPLAEVASPLEDMEVAKVSDHEARAGLERSQALLNEDLVVVAKVKPQEASLDVHVWHPVKGDPFFAAILTPPELTETQIIPRDITLMLDVSGSMKGTKIEQAKKAGLWLLGHLRPQDRINVMVFSDTIRAYAAKPVEATPEHLAKLRTFLTSTPARGGTALGDAVKRVMEMGREPGRASTAVLLTDGRATIGEVRPEVILQSARDLSAAGPRLYTFGVGQDLQATLLEGVATAAGGKAEVFREGGEIETRLTLFLVRTSAPAMVDLGVHVNGRTVDDLLPRPLPDVYLGEQAILCGRLPEGTEGALVVDAVLSGRPIRLSADLPSKASFSEGESGSTVARDLYAQAKLDYLQRAQRLRGGLSDDAYFAALDRGAYSSEDELVAALIDLSLATNVQCAYTSFLALLPEDRARLNPRNAAALEEALKRAHAMRAELAGVPLPESEAAKALDPEDARTEKLDQTTSGSAGFLIGRVKQNEGKVYRGPSSPGAGGPTTGGGGTYRGPGDAVPPGTPGAAGPGTARPTTGGAGFVRRGGSEGFEQWQFWWEHNKGRYLRRARGGRPGDPDLRRRMAEGLLPLLQSTDTDIVDSAVLALARLGDAMDAEQFTRALIDVLDHSGASARQAAILALGQVDTEASVQALRALMMDTKAGRGLAGTARPLEDMDRAFAAASLGMLRHVDSTPQLMAMVDSSKSGRQRNLAAMAIHALGLMPAGHEQLVPFLLEVMEDRKQDRMVQAQSPVALGRLLEGQEPDSPFVSKAVKALLDHLTDQKADDNLRRSAALGLGMLASLEDGAVVKALETQVERSSDDQTRHFALMALGQIGARSPRSEAHATAHEDLLAFLLERVHKPRRSTHVPHASLAVAVYTRAPGTPAEVRQQVVDQLRKTLDAQNNPSYLGAVGLALGLLSATEAKEALWEQFRDTNDQQSMGYLALSLGMLGVTDRVGELQQLIQKKGLDFKLRLQVARALGLLRDPMAGPLLQELLLDAETLAESSSAAQALGMIRDPSSAEPLLALAQDDRRQALQRAFACVALGLVLDRSDRPWNEVFSHNVNYRAKVPALAEILDLL